jgi:hypothetical protein
MQISDRLCGDGSELLCLFSGAMLHSQGEYNQGKRFIRILTEKKYQEKGFVALLPISSVICPAIILRTGR